MTTELLTIVVGVALTALLLWSVRKRRCPVCRKGFAVRTVGEWDGIRTEECEACGHVIETRY